MVAAVVAVVVVAVVDGVGAGDTMLRDTVRTGGENGDAEDDVVAPAAAAAAAAAVAGVAVDVD